MSIAKNKKGPVISEDEFISEAESRIISAANIAFLKNGIDGTTMAQIADEAGISRTSLHYYFRSKMQLYETVLGMLESKIMPAMSDIIEMEGPLTEKLEMFVDAYIDLIVSNPLIPSFVMFELQRNPDWVLSLFKTYKPSISKLSKQIDSRVARGDMHPISLPHLFADVIGLCIFPVLAKPLLMELMFKRKESEFKTFMEERKQEIMLVMKSRLDNKKISKKQTAL